MSYRADKLGDGRTDGLTDGRRTDGRTDAGNDNTRRPILASGKNSTQILSCAICKKQIYDKTPVNITDADPLAPCGVDNVVECSEFWVHIL